MEEYPSGGRNGKTFAGSGGMVLANVAKVVLMLVNMTFMVCGCLLVYFSHRIKNSGWLDAFEGDYAWVGDSAFLLILVLGAVVIALSALGCFGAWLQLRMLLMVYAIVLAITGATFVVVAFGANSTRSKANTWSDESYPADDAEVSLGENFNQLFCFAQVPYYCVDAEVTEVFAMFNLTDPGYFSSGQTNVSSYCGQLSLAQLDTVCEVCAKVAEYEQFDTVLQWAEEKCPRTSANQMWCGDFLLSAGADNAMTANAPFMECRDAVYMLIEKWSSILLWGSVAVVLSIVAVFALTCVLWQSKATTVYRSSYPTPGNLYPVLGSNHLSTPGAASAANNGNNNYTTTTDNFTTPSSHYTTVQSTQNSNSTMHTAYGGDGSNQYFTNNQYATASNQYSTQTNTYAAPTQQYTTGGSTATSYLSSQNPTTTIAYDDAYTTGVTTTDPIITTDSNHSFRQTSRGGVSL